MHKNKNTHIDKKPLLQGTWKKSYCFYLKSYKRIRTTERHRKKNYLAMCISGWQKRPHKKLKNHYTVVVKLMNYSIMKIKKTISPILVHVS